MYNLIIFDIDGTVQQKFSDELMPNVAEWFQWFKGIPPEHALYHCKLAFATNQGGVGLRMILERQGQDGSKYPTRDQVIDRMHALSHQLTGDQHAIMAVAALNYQDKYSGEWAIDYDPEQHFEWWNPDFRKPAAGMLDFIMDVQGVSAADTIMVGDSEDDQNAANAAGIQFVWAKDFFAQEAVAA